MSTVMDAQSTADSHRYFAIECNNLAWSLAESTAAIEQRDALLNAAHASAYHWQAIGTDLHKMRATMLLANVHALLGMGESALHYAEQMQSYFLAQPAVDDWELAFVHTVHARACASAGNRGGHLASYAAAEAAIAAITDKDDKAIVLVTFEQIPRPV